MIVVKLQGGLGNQMFQYAAGKALSEHSGKELKIDLSYLEQNKKQIEVFVSRPYELKLFPNIREDAGNFSTQNIGKAFRLFTFLRKKKLLDVFTESTMAYEPSFFRLKTPVLIDGFFQNEQYFLPFKSAILHAFQFPSLSGKDPNNLILQDISHTMSVAVHVRRGDYLNNLILQHHGLCSKEYYTAAIERINKQYPGAKFYFFSDDIAWVKKELQQLVVHSFLVEGNEGRNAWKDMLLMSKCKHQIIANSSFSWWGAWLNTNTEKTVIAPEHWFANKVLQDQTKDICPSSWIRI